MTLVGANANAKVTGLDPLPGKSNYFIGNDPKKWRTNVANYAKVRYADVYPGVDLVYYGNQGQLEYDFVVAPGANPKAIKLAVAAMSPSPVGGETPPLQIDASGDLVIATDAGEVRFRRPLFYQPQAGVGSRQSAVTTDEGPGTMDAAPAANLQSPITNRQFIGGSYKLIAKNQVAIEVGPYDKTLPLIIDPVLAYSARFSLGGSTVPGSMAVDASGSVYLAGVTSSTQFPATSGAFQTACTPDMQQPDSCQDAFVVKLNPEGSAVVYATFLGGSRRESVGGNVTIAVDASGNAYVAGMAWSVDFPTTPGAVQASCTLDNALYCEDAFVTKLSPDGSSLVYSTYLGGTDTDYARGIAVDPSGNAVVVGVTVGPQADFPTVNAIQPTSRACAGCANGFAAKLNATGTALVYSTYLGGSYENGTSAVAVDPQGNAYVTGYASAFTYCVPPPPGCEPTVGSNCPDCDYTYQFPVDFPTTPGAWQPSCFLTEGGSCGFLAKISVDGSQLVYSTFLGSASVPHGLAVDSAGNAYLASGHVYKLNAPGSALVYETAIGNTYPYRYSVNPIAVDAAGNAYVAGATQSRGFHTVNAIQPSLRGQGDCPGDHDPCPDAFVTKLNPDGSAVLFSTYFGGEGQDYGTSLAIDGSGNIYLAGTTDSYDFPTTSGTLTSLPQANVFVAKIAPEDAPGVALTPVPLRLPAEIDPSLPYQPTVTVRNMGTAPLTITDIAVTQGFVASSVDCLATLSPGAACTITVGYDSQAPLGPLGGTLTIADNAADSPQVVPLSGDRTPGTYPTLLPSTLDFGQQPAGTTSSPRTLTLTAGEQEEMAIYAITTSGDFAQTNNCPLAPSTLAAGGSCSISVTFKPMATGPKVGVVTVTHGTSYIPLAANLRGTGPGPTAIFSATSLSFADQLLGTTSPAQTVTLTNTGDAPLNITGIDTYGDFAQSNTCPSSLPPGANCIISVTFTPTAPRTRLASINISHNAFGNNRLVNLTGFCLGAWVSFSPSNVLSFNEQLLGTTSAPKTVTLTNIGNYDMTITNIAVEALGGNTLGADFAFTHSCGSPIAAGASCTISVTFTPTVVGTIRGYLTIYSNAGGSPNRADLVGIGFGPVATLSTTSLNFASQVVGTTSPPNSLTLSNAGNAPMTISSITASGAYAQSNDCVSPLVAGADCTITVTFTPTVVGGQSGTLTIADDAAGNPHTVALNGVGVGPVAVLSTSSLSFGNQAVSTTSAPKLVNLSNTGNAAMTVSSITADGNFAQTNNCPASLAGAGYCTISVTFTPSPTVPGGQSGTLTVADDASGSPHTVALNGVGLGPVASLSSNTLSFDGQIVGTTSAVEALTLSNSGNAPLTINSITISGAYAESNDCVSPLAAQASCAISVTFTPTVAGGCAGTLSVADSAAGSPHTVALNGVGQDFSLGAFTTARAVSPGMTARFNLLLRPQGGFNQTVALACSGAPAGATCSVSPSSVTPNGVNNVSVTLEVVTTAPAATAPRDRGGRRPVPPAGWPGVTTLALLGALALLAGVVLRRASSSARLRLLPVLGVCLLLVALVWAACGGGGGLYVRSGGTPAGTYALTITATAGNVSHSTTVELTVR